MVVVVELRRSVLSHVSGPIHSVHQENVRPAVVVVVDESHAGAHRFWEKFLTESPIVVDKTNTGLLCDFAKRNDGRGGRLSHNVLKKKKNNNRKNQQHFEKQAYADLAPPFTT